MYFLLQLSKFVILLFAPLERAKDFFCRFIKALGGQPNHRREEGGGGDTQMGYRMCCFIGYGVKAAKSRTGYRNQRATLG